jgi:hypothetical protein
VVDYTIGSNEYIVELITEALVYGSALVGFYQKKVFMDANNKHDSMILESSCFL